IAVPDSLKIVTLSTPCILLIISPFLLRRIMPELITTSAGAYGGSIDRSLSPRKRTVLLNAVLCTVGKRLIANGSSGQQRACRVGYGSPRNALSWLGALSSAG